MIGLFLASYKEEELTKLQDLFQTTLDYVHSYCNKGFCKDCQVRHICTDLTNAIDYISEYKSNTGKHTQM